LRRFAKGESRNYAPITPILVLLRSSDTLNRLVSLAKGDSRDLSSKDKLKLLPKLSEILDKLRRLLIKVKRDFTSVFSIQKSFRLRETL